MAKPLVSVVIPIHGEDIKHTVKAVKQSTYPNIELIIVDKGKERSYQRNFGIKKSHGKYILVLDSDQRISRSLINECVWKMEYDRTLQGIYIPEVIPPTSFFNKVRNFERSFYTSTAVDVVRFVRSDNCPMFNEELSGPEDSAWDREIGGDRATSRSTLYHYDNIGLLDYIRKKAYYCKSMKRYHELYPEDKVLKLWYRCFWIFIENDKWLRLLRHPILSLGIFGIILIRGFLWITK